MKKEDEQKSQKQMTKVRRSSNEHEHTCEARYDDDEESGKVNFPSLNSTTLRQSFKPVDIFSQFRVCISYTRDDAVARRFDDLT